MSAGDYLSPQDLADEFRVPLTTVYRWNTTGTGPATIRVGRHVRYRRADVERWVATRRANR